MLNVRVEDWKSTKRTISGCATLSRDASRIVLPMYSCKKKYHGECSGILTDLNDSRAYVRLVERAACALVCVAEAETAKTLCRLERFAVEQGRTANTGRC